MIILLNFNGNWLHHGALSELSHFGKAFYREIESGNHYNAGQKQIKNHDGKVREFPARMVYLRNREEMRAQFRIVPIHKPTAIQI